MSVEENKEIVRRYQEAYNTASYDALDDVVAADVLDRKSTRLNSSHIQKSRMPSSA